MEENWRRRERENARWGSCDEVRVAAADRERWRGIMESLSATGHEEAT